MSYLVDAFTGGAPPCSDPSRPEKPISSSPAFFVTWKAGAEFLVTRRGKPVARIVPAEPSRERQLTPEQEAAHARSMRRLRKGWDLGGETFDRDQLYDELLDE